jgi:hypothetical protein
MIRSLLTKQPHVLNIQHCWNLSIPRCPPEGSVRLHTSISSAALLLGSAFTAAPQQPNPEAFLVRNEKLDLRVDFAEKRLSGAMTLEMENWTAQPASTVSFILHRLMEASQVRDGAGAALPYTQDVLRFQDEPMHQVTQIVVKLPRPIGAGGRTTVRINYAGYLTPYTEMGWLYVKDHIDTTFTILRRDALAFPEVGGLSRAANRQMPYPDFTYEAEVRVPSKYLVATGGAVTRTPHEDGTTTWQYTSGKTSPFLNISIAPFDTISAGGIRVFYFAADSTGARRLVNSAQTALRTLTQWFGRLHTEANLTIAEIPDGWGSQGHLVGGIIQTASAFRDANQVGQLYHELSHLWNAIDRDTPPPRWNEGLASFLENLMRERLDGWNGLKSYEVQWITSMKQQVASDSMLRTAPFIEYGKREMTGRSYTVGRIMFATLYELLGEAEFNKVVGGYYQQFTSGGTTRDFVAFARRTATHDLSTFFDDWMFTTRWTGILASETSVSEVAAHYK